MIAISFVVSLIFVYLTISRFPSMTKYVSPSTFTNQTRDLENGVQSLLLEKGYFGLLRNPSSNDISLIRSVVLFYMEGNYSSVVTVLCTIYIFLQAFAIPGPAVLAVLMAALFGGWYGAIMSMTCSVVGSSICYILFKLVGGPVLDRFFKSGVNKLRGQIHENKDNIFFFFLFLRITPILPNWFINISSGNLGIPFSTFVFGTIFGLIPNAVILARAGVEIATIGQENGGLKFDLNRALGLLAIGLLALLPVVLKRRYKTKLT